ncbi:MAG TPA: glucose-6-phosphate dehydrogenase assembly protein OpcA [Roseiflexaceae bacterium]|nr:glucose-6-phosphate dehydrogenase assembly protein OpcA [Roseiflexaceae bacterium]HMP41676.1 glucose-6-phosphate dehydrogenase assembly protein OpcA [Roseiflexaceae bacterium]
MASIPPLEQVRVDIRAIERELTAIWKSVADGRDDARAAVTRTCVLNLLVLSFQGMKGIDPATAIIDRLTSQHPNRAIVIGVNEGASEPLLDAWVQAHCQMPAPGRPQVCCEQITIEARGALDAGQISGLVLPLLVPDLPVMLWLPEGAALDHELTRRVRGFADRVIVDTASFTDPLAALRQISALSDEHVEISDLTWGRLTAWRELVAQLFDAHDHQAYLAKVERMTIDYLAGDATAHAQALLLAGWFASRLHWQYIGHTAADTIQMEHGDRPVGIELRPRPDAAAPVAGIEIFCTRGRFGVICDAAPDRAIATVDISGRRQVRQTARLDLFDNADLLAHELRLLGHDTTYNDALHLAVAMLHP